jgi:putative intracellular protease/amidase
MKPIHIVLSESFSDWEIAPLTGVGRSFYSADIRFSAANSGSLKSAGGMTVCELPVFGEAIDAVVVVCGGPAFESESPPDFSNALRSAFQNRCIIAGICGGTLALARAGLLDSVRHTSNAANYVESHVPDYRGSALYVDQPRALRDGRIITAPAPAPATFAAEVLRSAGLETSKADELVDMLSREHSH